MITLIVKVDVKSDRLFDFIDETKIASSRAMQYERGCKGYTINKDADNENGIILIEQYASQTDIDNHKTTEHFLTWRANVEDMMNSPRQVTRYDSIN